MPGKARPGKARTRKSAAKRIKVTKGGKGDFAHEKAANNHLLQQKSRRQKRLAGRTLKLKGHKKMVKKMLPN